VGAFYARRRTPTSFPYETENKNGSQLTVRGEPFLFFTYLLRKVGDQLCPRLHRRLLATSSESVFVLYLQSASMRHRPAELTVRPVVRRFARDRPLGARFG
jgi:hypothetical protein